MSEFRDFELQHLGPSAADPQLLARAVKKHQIGDVVAQIALTIVLMLAICAVTFVLSLDRAAAASLEPLEGTAVSTSLTAFVTLFGLAAAFLLVPQRKLKPIPVRVRARRTLRRD
ncbi:hypothetical protein [Azorhizobium doebereinerae]|uniref:hypothetical protein n=1 Tax=Azorhizobium doebereinerae TaxID=281091 RepID=UPI00048AA0AA|nr:hypothetical protein [Azorhizobium doebereinerae]